MPLPPSRVSARVSLYSVSIRRAPLDRRQHTGLGAAKRLERADELGAGQVLSHPFDRFDDDDAARHAEKRIVARLGLGVVFRKVLLAFFTAVVSMLSAAVMRLT